MGLLDSITGDGLLGGALGFLGQRSANKANSAQAARSMEFQREMAKNAHQYEVADLKKAGLNPLLSGTGGKGASASGGAQAKIENEANSAMTARLLNAQVNKLNEETELIKKGTPGRVLGTDVVESIGSVAPALGGAASAFGAQKLFNKHKNKIKSKPKLKTKTKTKPKLKTKSKSKSRGGGGMYMPFKNPRANAFRKF